MRHWFRATSELDVSIVDPPRPHLVALGCDHGLSASGGGKVRVRVDGREVSVAIERGVTPAGAARVLAAAITKAGFVARVSDNPVIGAAVRGSSDVLVRRKSGDPRARRAPVSGSISSGRTAHGLHRSRRPRGRASALWRRRRHRGHRRRAGAHQGIRRR
ncbi:MAG: hypothetical protein IPM54_02860 [Polyangiaceae bacterium]|nr:hypothetical protein [Polyangiaceae bacterium]